MPHVFYAAHAGGLPGASGAAAWGRARRGDFRDAQGGSGCAGHAQPVGAARHARGAAGRARQTAVAVGRVADLVGAESAVAEVAPHFQLEWREYKICSKLRSSAQSRFTLHAKRQICLPVWFRATTSSRAAAKRGQGPSQHASHGSRLAAHACRPQGARRVRRKGVGRASEGQMSHAATDKRSRKRRRVHESRERTSVSDETRGTSASLICERRPGRLSFALTFYTAPP